MTQFLTKWGLHSVYCSTSILLTHLGYFSHYFSLNIYFCRKNNRQLTLSHFTSCFASKYTEGKLCAAADRATNPQFTLHDRNFALFLQLLESLVSSLATVNLFHPTWWLVNLCKRTDIECIFFLVKFFGYPTQWFLPKCADWFCL